MPDGDTSGGLQGCYIGGGASTIDIAGRGVAEARPYQGPSHPLMEARGLEQILRQGNRQRKKTELA